MILYTYFSFIFSVDVFKPITHQFFRIAGDVIIEIFDEAF